MEKSRVFEVNEGAVVKVILWITDCVHVESLERQQHFRRPKSLVNWYGAILHFVGSPRSGKVASPARAWIPHSESDFHHPRYRSSTPERYRYNATSTVRHQSVTYLVDMSKYGTLVMGPAGAGKTTFCSALIQHLRLVKRSCFYINLDPAAEDFAYEPDLDIKDLISLEDVMEEVGLGPNGGLIYCFEFLLENLDFLSEAIEPLSEEYLIIIDMPGQIELYTHIPVVPALVQHLTRSGALHVRLCAAYLLESTFVIDRAKFFAGTLSAMSAMIMLELPHVNIMSKMDLVKGSLRKKDLKRFIDPDSSLLDEEQSGNQASVARNEADPTSTEEIMGGGSFNKLNKAVARLIDDFSMVSFLQLNVQDEDSVGAILSYIDDAIQYHEAQEPREPNDEIRDWEDTAMT